MAKKQKQPPAADSAHHDAADNTAQSSRQAQADSPSTPSKPKTPEPSLIISRNKHWKYISAFHGPWLQLPPEVLESLAHANYSTPRPHPIDPAVFYDLVRIRKAVDEATNLAVRATSGLTSAALSSQVNANNGLLGSAAALGLGYPGGHTHGGNAKLSRERKFRMRELATQKLSQAYHLDEIAASVATMQSASTLEDVAQFVLQRNTADADAKYVHFFHERIPSRQMAEYTPLEPLDDIVAERPTDGAAFRTRALTRLFKEDYLAAARDLTEGLAVDRYLQQQHKAGRDQLVLAKTAREEAEKRAYQGYKNPPKVEEEDQPSSLEQQLLFHRAGVYFSLACQHVHRALNGLKDLESKRKAQQEALGEDAELPPLSPQEKEAHTFRLEHRKLVKMYARRAVRDYLAFLSRLDYCPGIDPQIADDFLRRMNDAAEKLKNDPNHNPSDRVLDISEGTATPASSTSTSSASSTSNALVRHEKKPSPNPNHPPFEMPPHTVHPISALFSSTPLPDLPAYPPIHASVAASPFTETITFHPLLPDALHALLLCHALLQTPPTELRRHAVNAARLIRVAEGYPVFLAARSAARADWCEVLRRTGDWVSLGCAWEALCKGVRPSNAPVPSATPFPSHTNTNNTNGTDTSTDTDANGDQVVQNGSTGDPAQPQPETEKQRRTRLRHEAVLEALADERVVDEESFAAAVHARERRYVEDQVRLIRGGSIYGSGDGKSLENGGGGGGGAGEADGKSGDGGKGEKDGGAEKNGSGSGNTTGKAGGKEDTDATLKAGYEIRTERADAIARWVREAPASTGEGRRRKKGKKKGHGAPRVGRVTEALEGLDVEAEGEGEDDG